MKILQLSVIWFSALFMFPAITYGMSDSTVVSIQEHLKEARQFSQSGNVQQSLKHYFDALQLAEATGNTWYTALTSLRIGALFNQYYRYEESIPYLKKTYNLLNGSDSTKLLASVSNSIAWDYIKINNVDSALTYSERSIELYKKIRPQATIAYCIALESLGEIYSFKGRYEEAQAVLDLSMQLGKEMNNEVVVGFTNYGLALNEFNKKNLSQARVHILACLPVAEKYAENQLLADVHHLAYTILDSRKEGALAYTQLKKYTALKDKLHSEDIERKAAIINASYEIQKKENEVKILSQRNDIQQLEIERQTLTRNITILGLIGVLIVTALIYKRYQFIRKTNKIIEAERERSERLLLNILPEQTARELKERGVVQARKFESATVLFSDFKDFTKSAEFIEPELLVRSIDYYFKAFDQITLRHGLEKIKTIGDSYMCAGGLSENNNEPCRNMVLAAREMVEVVNQKLQSADDLVHFEIRIGIHTGPVVAGIVGDTKWQYDIWGDTVNIASRMETSSVAGRINISETTYQQIKDEFPCEYRGVVDIKHPSPMGMYFIS